MAIACYILTLCATNGGENLGRVLEYKVPCVEINYKYCLDAEDKIKLSFVQLIWWEINEYGEATVIDWIMCKEQMKPLYSHKHQLYISDFYHPKTNQRKRIYSTSKIESHTFHDPEIENRDILPTILRKGLEACLIYKNTSQHYRHVQ